jgi:GPI-anchor transamidase subunit GAA1
MFAVFATINCLLPQVLSHTLTTYYKPSEQQYQLIKSFSLLLLGMFLSALATLNFSLAFLIGLLASPLTFMQPWPDNTALRWTASGFLNLVAPPAVIYASAASFNVPIGQVLKEAAFGWDIWGMYTPVVIWCVWWPAWLVGSSLVLGQPSRQRQSSSGR